MRTRLLVCAPLRAEAWALRAGLGSRPVYRTGCGLRHSARSVVWLARCDVHALAVAGLAGGLDPTVRSGDVVVGSEVLHPDGSARPLSGARVAEELRRQGLTVHCGPIVTTSHLVNGTERAELARTGALAVDMESAVLAAAAEDRAFAVVRVVMDTAREPLLDVGTPRRAGAALRQLRRTAGALVRWADSVAGVDEGNPSASTREVL